MKQGMKSPAELLTPGRALTLANVAEGAEGLVVSDLARARSETTSPSAPSATLASVTARPGVSSSAGDFMPCFMRRVPRSGTP